MSTLSIVIPTRGQSTSLPEVIAGLECQRPPLQEQEVLLVVDARGSTDDARRLAAIPRSFPVKVLQATIPGASAARNVGWRAASAPIILFLDDDVVPCTSLIAEHTEWHSLHPQPEIGVLGTVHWSPKVRVTPFMRWLDMGIQFDFGKIRTTEIGWQQFYSCNVSLKQKMLELADGFDDQRFPFRYEDIELARRLQYGHDFRLLYNPLAVGEHLKRETVESWRRNLADIAHAERRFTELYPNERAYFYERFRDAADAPPARGRTARLARFVHPEVPWLGRIVWQSFDLVCSQQLAPEFLARWQDAQT